MIEISVSLLSIEDNLIDKIKLIEKTDANYIHVDIMDGKFVPNKTFIFSQIKKITNYTTKKLDVHLMVNNPLKYIDDYCLLNVEYITIHYEIGNMAYRALDYIKSRGIKCGLSINPSTEVEKIFPLLNDIDLVLVMSVNPGLGGQAFMPIVIDKIRKLKEEINNRNLNIKIEVDGGINYETANSVKEIGADIIVSGSYITNSDNYQEAINRIRNS